MIAKTGRKKQLLVLSFLLFLFLNVNAQCPTATCTPSGFTGWTFQLGITNVTLNTINYTSADRSGGDPTYVDYACSQSTNLVAGNTYSLSINTTSGYTIKVKAWIDFNNDGFLNNSTEAVFAASGVGTKTGNITIPSSGVVTGLPLRLRIASDEQSRPALDPCNNPVWGQTEDYAIVINQNTNPPSSDFSATNTVLCNGFAEFTDLTANQPNSWKWYFGDGDSSTVQNPTHIYSTNGIFTVTLIATNNYGSDTIIKSNYIDNSAVGPTLACVPGTATNAGLGFGAGIYNVTLNTINNSSGGDVDGYRDYSCNLETILYEGTPYNISITTGNTFDENVRVYVDKNNDGIFGSGELLFSSSGLGTHTGTITIPTTAILDTSLRLRVWADYIGGATPNPCTTPQYSQVEDYSVYVIQNTNPPVADFDADKLITCDGTIKFNDLSINGAASWNWNFGDGNTSTSQSPNHLYLTPGTYTVTLTVVNANGTDSITKVDYITYHDTIPTSACTPVTSNYCCGYGISNFTFNTINVSSNDGIDGYEDFTCTDRTHIIEGQSYNYSVSTSSSVNQTTRAWIDFNDDGVFNHPSEMIFEAIDVQNPSGSVIIPNGVVFDTPLRLRVISDYSTSSFDPCFNVIHGQAEDYTVIVEENQIPPIADFNADPLVTCDSVISFYDLSLNSPDSYLWDFGDGTTDTLQNPIHAYSAPGSYTITLIVTNDVGMDTIIKTNYVNYNPSPTASCVPSTVNFCCNTGIHRFVLNDIDNASGNASTSYEDFSCIYFTTLQAGKTHPVSITTGNEISEHVIIWIDLNNDGSFDNSTEQVYSGTSFQFQVGNIDIPRIAIYDTLLRMRIGSERSSSPIPSGCSNLFNGQYEDYGIILTKPDSIVDNLVTALNSDFGIYPNPASGVFHIKNTSMSTIQNITIINSIGETVLYQMPKTNSIDISSLQNGIYIVSIRTENEIINKKLVIDEK